MTTAVANLIPESDVKIVSSFLGTVTKTRISDMTTIELYSLYTRGNRGVRQCCLEEMGRRNCNKDREAAASAVNVESGDYQIRMDTIDALIEEGKAPHVAANLTNTTVKMVAEAKRLGVL